MSHPSKPLYDIHDVRLLREQRIAQLRRPIELIGHYGEYARDCHERFHVLVPRLLGNRGRKSIAFQVVLAWSSDSLARAQAGRSNPSAPCSEADRNKGDRSEQLIELL